MPDPLLFGVDFTSSPRRAKPIVVATLERLGTDAVRFIGLEALTTWPMFDDVPARPAPPAVDVCEMTFCAWRSIASRRSRRACN